MTEFTKGTKVRIVGDYYTQEARGRTAVVAHEGHKGYDLIIVFDGDDFGWSIGQYDLDGQFVGRRGWYINAYDLDPIIEEPKKVDTITLGVPVDAMNSDLRLKPQARKILAHLQAGKTISPLEAQNVYAVYRLAASIREIRQAGYNIVTSNRKDEAGHKYARYSLAA